MTHYVISSSGGNDSVAMIQWAHEASLDLFGTVTVTYCDTGWAKPGWIDRVEQVEAFASRLGFAVERITSMGMADLVRHKQGWPGNGQQFCTAHLKGVPFLTWIDEIDKGCEAMVMVGKRRVESIARQNTPEFVADSEYHGGRTLWHPLYLHTHTLRGMNCSPVQGLMFYPTEAKSATHVSMPTVATSCGLVLTRWQKSMRLRSRSVNRCFDRSDSTDLAFTVLSCGHASANTMNQIFPKTRVAVPHSGVDFN